MSLAHGHVLWAYDGQLWEWWHEGCSLEGIRAKLRDEWGLRVSTNSIRSMLRAGNPGGTIYNLGSGRELRPLP